MKYQHKTLSIWSRHWSCYRRQRCRIQLYNGPARQINPYTDLDRHWGLQETEAVRIYSQSAYEVGKAPAAFIPRRYPWYSFLLEAQSTPVHWSSQWKFPVTL